MPNLQSPQISNSSFKFVVLPSQISKFTWKHIVTKHEFDDITLKDFRTVIDASDGWQFIKQSDFRYHIQTGGSKLDEWVRRGLYQWDKSVFDKMHNYTKAPRLGRGLHSLLKYCGPAVYKSRLFDAKMNSIYESNLDSLRQMFSKTTVLPLDIIADKIPKNTSAGFNFPGLKKEEALPEAIKNVEAMIENWKNNVDNEQIPCKLGLRGHLSPEDQNKTRVIWVSPIEHILIENMLFRGFNKQIQSYPAFARFFMTGAQTMERLQEYLQQDPDLSFINSDISGWDSLRARFIITDIFNKVLRPNMILTEPWMEKAFEYCLNSFIFTHLVLPDGSIYKKVAGVPSGSYLTLLVNSLAVWNVCSSSLSYLNIDARHKRVLGDDFCFKIDFMVQSDLDALVSDFSEVMLQFFALVVKPSKVIATNVLDSRKFIGYQFVNGQLHKEDDDIFAAMMYPETPVKDLGVSFTRVYAYMLIGGFASLRVFDFFRHYVGYYYDAMKRIESGGIRLFKPELLISGNLQVFKHVMEFKLADFEGMTIDSILSTHVSKAAYALSLGIKYIRS